MTSRLYYSPFSPPCRAVLLAAKAFGANLDLKLVDLMKGEHLKPEFAKINPQHCVPVLNDDDGFELCESRAIMTYLANKYGTNDSLYPKDLKKRALVDQKLYFDMSTLYAGFGDYYMPVMFMNANYDPIRLEKVKANIAFLDTFLKGRNYIVGDNLTLADLSLVTTVSTLEAVSFDLSAYEHIARWYNIIKNTAPGYDEADGKNAKIFKKVFEKLTKMKKAS